MPGPVNRHKQMVRDSSESVFQSCESVQGWATRNGNLDLVEKYKQHNNEKRLLCEGYQEVVIDYQDCTTTSSGDIGYQLLNGTSGPGDSGESSVAQVSEKEMSGTEEEGGSEEREEDSSESEGRAEKSDEVEDTQERKITSVEEGEEEMEVEEEEEEGEAIKLPMVEARLNIDIGAALTRQKIASIQRGRTLSYVDKEDGEEPPTRRPHAHHRESVEGASLLLLRQSHVQQQPMVDTDSPPIIHPPSTRPPPRVSRNPSYTSAVRDATILSPRHTLHADDRNARDSSEDANSPDASPRHNLSLKISDAKSESILCHTSASKGVTSPAVHKAGVLAAANLPRSASFSGAGVLVPSSPPISGGLSEGNNRRFSVSQPTTPTLPRALQQTFREAPAAPPVRGSSITRSFRRLFSTPVRLNTTTPTSPTSPPTDDLWADLSDLEPQSPTTSDSRPRSRLRRLSSSLSRKLSTKPKMANSNNGLQQILPNGTSAHEDVRQLVQYDDLVRLFCCSGCQVLMSPPLNQCRKGHLVCATCRTSLKQVCPVCKQRFAENTNLMMEQVCQLIKFPCKWASQGCPEYYPLKSRLDHEHFCVYRPVHCHHGPNGCPKILLLRDMHQHLDQCPYKDSK